MKMEELLLSSFQVSLREVRNSFTLISFYVTVVAPSLFGCLEVRCVRNLRTLVQAFETPEAKFPKFHLPCVQNLCTHVQTFEMLLWQLVWTMRLLCLFSL